MNKTQAQLAHLRANPVEFVRWAFHVEPDAWQAKALNAIAGPGVHRLALKACAGPGKSALDAWVVWYFLALYAKTGALPKGAVLSNTKENLRDNLWAELHKWRSRSEWLKQEFEINSEKAYQVGHKEEWFISARSFPKTANPEIMGEVLSGLHSEFVLIVLDESGATHPVLLKRAEQAMSGVEWGLILQSGNPLSREGCLYAVENDPAWTKIRITGDPDDPDRSPRVDIDQARDMIKKYGREDPWVMAYILGMFPNTSLNVLLGEADVRACMGRHLPVTVWSWAQKRIGIDCARFGDDRTVMFPRQGKAAFPCVVIRKQDGPAVAGRYAQAKAKFGSEADSIDDTGGWASSVIDFSRLAGNYLLPVNMSGSPDDDRYHNKRAEVYFRAAEWVKAGGALPPDEDLVREATAAQYFINRQGKLQIEEKDQIKKRLGFSPDKWDAFCLTFATAEQAGAARAAQVQGGQGRMVAARVDDENPLQQGVDMVADRTHDFGYEV